MTKPSDNLPNKDKKLTDEELNAVAGGGLADERQALEALTTRTNGQIDELRKKYPKYTR